MGRDRFDYLRKLVDRARRELRDQHGDIDVIVANLGLALPVAHAEQAEQNAEQRDKGPKSPQ
jgi:NADP-dependent 3-hydroxy acid dehydrogenase YdfG